MSSPPTVVTLYPGNSLDNEFCMDPCAYSILQALYDWDLIIREQRRSTDETYIIDQ